MAEFEVKCNECNTTLDADFYSAGRGVVLDVDPCPKCLENAREEVSHE